jgi:large subunit ribosomal protein L29
MTAAEIRTHSDDEMQQMLDDLKDELFGLKFQQILGQLEDTTVLKKTRKDIARIKTVLRERELGTR